MKTLYVCGDSFATPDPEYGPMWVDLLAEHLGTDWHVVNLSSVAASNTLISLQVDHAIANHADYIIMLATAVTRDHAATQHISGGLLERFQAQDLVSYSIFRPYRSALSVVDQQQIKDFHSRYFDLDLAIYENQCIITNTLDRLAASGQPFKFDQGGFEHPGFGGQRGYFTQYDLYRSDVNLWDLGTTEAERPYYHITDQLAHQRVAEYYYNAIRQ